MSARTGLNVKPPTTRPDQNISSAFIGTIKTDNIIGSYSDWKIPVDNTTTTNITLSGLQGYALMSRILVKDQTDQVENGIYYVKETAWERTEDLPVGVVAAGVVVYTKDSTALYFCDNTTASVVGTNDITFDQINFFGGLGNVLNGIQFKEVISGITFFGDSPKLLYIEDTENTMYIGDGTNDAIIVNSTASDLTLQAADEMIVSSGSTLTLTSGGASAALSPVLVATASNNEYDSNINFTSTEDINITNSSRTTLTAGTIYINDDTEIKNNGLYITKGAATAANTDAFPIILNSAQGIVTITNVTLDSGASVDLVINNNTITSDSLILTNIQNFSGSTGAPSVQAVDVTDGQMTLKLSNFDSNSSRLSYSETQRLVATNVSGGEAQMGYSVSLNSDGSYLAAGGILDGASGSEGAVWIFVRSGTTWTQQAKLIGTGSTGTNIYQGQGVSLNSDATYLAESGRGHDGSRGAVWIFTRSGSNWTQQAKLTAAGIVGFAGLSSVSLNSDATYIAVGGPPDDSGEGATWIFTRSGTNWTQQGSKLVGFTPVGKARQGESVSLNSDATYLAIGGSGDNSNVGATWIFTRSGTNWTQQAKLVGSGNIGASRQGPVSLNSDATYLAVGGYDDNSGVGAAWIFTRSGTNWTQQGPKLVGTGATGGSRQGDAVSLNPDGNVLVVGGSGDNSGVGATWVFTRTGTTWTQRGPKLVGNLVTGDDTQGWSVSLSSDSSIIAAGGTGDANADGAVFIFNGYSLTGTAKIGYMVL